MPRWIWVPLLLAISMFLGSAGCQKGAARECDEFFSECPLGQRCDFGTSQCVDAVCSSCPADKPACDPVAQSCVECIDSGPQDACPERRLCDKNQCKSCTEDRECDGLLCLRNGGCPKPVDIAYVAAGGAGTECSLTAPCTLPAALATGRGHIRVRDNQSIDAALQINRAVQVYGPKELARPRITRSTPGAIFEVSGNGVVELRDLELGGATGATGHGIAVTGGAPTLDLETVDVIGNSGLGISAGGALLKVTFALIVNNAGGGINAGGRVELENNIIAGNGSATSATGGVRLTSAATASTARFLTVANNQAMAGVGSGADCAGAQALSSVIFAGNTMIGCTAIYSLFPVGTTVPGTGNKTGDPQFLSATLPANRDDESFYHLMATSPAVGAAEPLPTNIVISDIDGDGRAVSREIGADELR